MADEDEDPQQFLSKLFAVRHELLTIKTMAEQGRRDLSAGNQVAEARDYLHTLCSHRG